MDEYARYFLPKKAIIFTLCVSLCSSNELNSTNNPSIAKFSEDLADNLIDLEPNLLPYQSLSESDKRRLLEDSYRNRGHSKKLEHEKMIGSRQFALCLTGIASIYVLFMIV